MKPSEKEKICEKIDQVQQDVGGNCADGAYDRCYCCDTKKSPVDCEISS